MTQETAPQDFRLILAQQVFLYKSKDVPGVDKAKLQAEILATVVKEDMAPYYEHLCGELSWQLDGAKLAAMQAANKDQLEQLESKIKDAEENLGETEVRDAMAAKADYLGKIGDRDASAAAYKATEDKTASGGAKADMLFSQIRLAILYGDWQGVKALLVRTKTVCDAGGDWEHKNKLKVYEGVFSMFSRDFKRAASLFLDSIQTFTTTELFPYSQVVAYSVVTSVVALDRPTLKTKVVDSPEILAVIGQLPGLGQFVNSLYSCRYKEFFRAFVQVMDMIRSDLYLHPHLKWYMREARLVAYTQFLDAYKSVTLDSMAAAFEVSAPFLDQEVSNYICAGRISAKIDKVAGIIETKRPDAKNALYNDVMKKGDQLLNQVQKLSRVIDVE